MDDYVMKFDNYGIEFLTWWQYINQVNSEFLPMGDIDKLRRALNFVFYLSYDPKDDTKYNYVRREYKDIWIAYKKWKLLDRDTSFCLNKEEL